jgi:Alpha/beta hydrolase domain
MVTISGPVTAGSTIEPAGIVATDLPANGYVEQEFLASGTASAYDPTGEVGSDGRWVAEASDTAPFCTSDELLTKIKRQGNSHTRH